MWKPGMTKEEMIQTIKTPIKETGYLPKEIYNKYLNKKNIKGNGKKSK